MLEVITKKINLKGQTIAVPSFYTAQLVLSNQNLTKL